MKIEDLEKEGRVNTNQTYAALEIWKKENCYRLMQVLGKDRQIYIEFEQKILSDKDKEGTK